MDYDQDKVDDYTLALLHLVIYGDGGVTRAWKAFDWDTMDRLYEKGLISNPKSKAKSVVMTDEGQKKSEELFQKLFGK